MSDNLDFMAIFGGEGSLDLGSGGEDFDALFAEKEPAPQPPKEKVPETTETAQPEKAPAETPEPEEKKEDANAPEKNSRSPAPTGRSPGEEACGSHGGSHAPGGGKDHRGPGRGTALEAAGFPVWRRDGGDHRPEKDL